MELKGKIIAVMEKRSGVAQQSGKAWATQDYVIETINEQYPKRCVFNVFGEENIQKFALEVGKVVTIHFDINAREYNGRWYNDIRAWRVDPEQATAQAAPVTAPTAPIDIPAPTMTEASQEVEDLPF